MNPGQNRTHELEQALALLRASLDASPDAILVTDAAGRVEDFNSRLGQLLGRDAVSAKGLPAVEALAGFLSLAGEPAKFKADLGKSPEQDETTLSGTLELAGGGLLEYHGIARRLGGKIIGRSWSLRDVSQPAGTADVPGGGQYQTLFDYSPSPKYVYDRETLSFVTVNLAALNHYGYSRGEFLALNMRDLMQPEDLPAFTARIGALPGLTGGAGVWRHRRKNGTFSEMAVTAHALDFSGRKTWLILAMDVSERLSLEAQLRHSQRMESIGMLAGGVAHDFNNLLTVIQGHAGLAMATENLPPRIANSLREISQASRRAADLTRQLLTFSRKQAMQPQIVDLNEIIANVAKMLRRVLGEDVRLETVLAPNLPPVKADVGMLEQVLLNLALNSRDAMPRGGILRVETREVTLTPEEAAKNSEARAGRHLCVSLEDTGCGIPAENLPRIFEPFFTTKELDRGTGLGLATVYGIIRQHSGWLEVSSVVDEGATFRILLPASSLSAPVEAVSAGAALPEIGGTETLLVVEDEEPLLKLMEHILESHGYKVLGCTTGRQALDLWQDHRQKIDLLLTDMILPDGMTGPELSELLRNSKPGLKVIFTSGYDSGKFNVTGQPPQGADFLQKPFHARKLAEVVHACLTAK